MPQHPAAVWDRTFDPPASAAEADVNLMDAAIALIAQVHQIIGTMAEDAKHRGCPTCMVDTLNDGTRLQRDFLRDLEWTRRHRLDVVAEDRRIVPGVDLSARWPSPAEAA